MTLLFLLACKTPVDGLPSSAPMTETQLEAELTRLGNLESEQERYQGLMALHDVLTDQSVYDTVQEDLGTLLPIIDLWSNGLEHHWVPGEQDSAGEGGYLGGFFLMRVFPGQTDNSYPPPVMSSVLKPMWEMYRGRMLIWTAIENGLLSDTFYQEGLTLLESAHAAYPDNPILPMYLGEKVAWTHPDLPETAPTWVHQQHQAMSSLGEIIDFWITDRQAPDGQFGGGWGDDVEMWRWWSPILLGYDDETLTDAQRLLAEGIFDLERLSGGYTNMVIDVEHGSEDTADSLTPMLLLFPEEELWQQRARRISTLMRTLWTDTNDLGHRQFKSSYFSSDEVSDSEDRACDTPYHTRVLQPALLLWQLTNDDEVGVPISEWLSGWTASSMLEANGKPSGIPPAAIAFPSGEPFGDDWWNPGCHYTDATFRYPRAFSMLGQAMVLAAHQHANSDYVELIDHLAQRSLDPTVDSSETGSESWAIQEIKGKLLSVLEKQWLLTGTSASDELLLEHGGDYIRYRITGEDAALESALVNPTTALSWNKAMYTSEVRFTDRVLKFHTRYWNGIAEAPLPGVDTSILYNMVTGDIGEASILPLPAVRWGFPHQTLRVNVQTASPTALRAQLYNTAPEDHSGEVVLQRLIDGHRQYTLQCESSEYSEDIEGDAFTLTLPSQTLCTIEVKVQ
ncbi:MAG: hypothetical protein VXZ96_12230 [Myxococcota bacterium]|nr:hypothetical protein [Myxococcota bacterium]